MRRRYLFDAPTNCNVQTRARLRTFIKANREALTTTMPLIPPPDYCICCGVELDETRRGQYCGAMCEYALTLIQQPSTVRPGTYLWTVNVQYYPLGHGMSVSVGLVLLDNPRYHHVQALDELDDPRHKTLYAETWDQAQSVKQAWLDRPSSTI